MARFGIDAFDRPDHFRCEQDVVRRHHFGEEIDAGLVIDAGIEENVVLDDLDELRPSVVERNPAEAAPVERHRPAAVRDDQLERRKVLEQVGQDELHERHRIGVEVIGARRMHGRVTAARHVNHGRDIELGHFFIKRIPPLVGQGRRVEITARRIGIEVATDETHLDAALEFADRVLRRHAGRLRQLTHADEILRKQRDDAGDQIVANLRPFEADALVADVMAHARGARREDRQVRAAFALQFELVLLDAFADFIVRHFQRGARRHRRFSARCRGRGLFLAETMKILGLGGVVAVTIDNHAKAPYRSWGNADATALGAIVKQALVIW